MKLRRLRAVARKEFYHVLRDPRSMAMGIALPMLMLFVFGFALTLDVDRVPLVVWDQSNTPASREVVAAFTGSRYFALVGEVYDYREVVQEIDAGRTLLALVVPRDFARQAGTPGGGRVQLLCDGSDANTATIAMNYAEAVVEGCAEAMTLRASWRAGGRTVAAPIESCPRVWYNADMQSKNFIVPGLIAVIMMVIAALLTSLTVAREWEQGTMEQLIATPVTPAEVVLGKLTPYFAIGMIDMVLAVVMGEFLFHVPLRGSLILLFCMSSIYLIGVLSLGILVSIVTKSQLLASQLAMVLTLLPSFLLSGFMIPVVNMPAPIQALTKAVPATYFVTLLRGIYLKGVGPRILAGEIVLLTAFAAAMLLLALVKFKKKLT